MLTNLVYRIIINLNTEKNRYFFQKDHKVLILLIVILLLIFRETDGPLKIEPDTITIVLLNKEPDPITIVLLNKEPDQIII